MFFDESLLRGWADAGDIREEGAEDDVDGDMTQSLAPAAQLVNTACWLTLGEAATLLGRLAETVPVSGAAGLIASCSVSSFCDLPLYCSYYYAWLAINGSLGCLLWNQHADLSLGPFLEDQGHSATHIVFHRVRSIYKL